MVASIAAFDAPIQREETSYLHMWDKVACPGFLPGGLCSAGSREELVVTLIDGRREILNLASIPSVHLPCRLHGFLLQAQTWCTTVGVI